jgi:hypothetical protein
MRYWLITLLFIGVALVLYRDTPLVQALGRLGLSVVHLLSAISDFLNRARGY